MAPGALLMAVVSLVGNLLLPLRRRSLSKYLRSVMPAFLARVTGTLPRGA